jgi:hypothetical protein
MIDIWNYCLRKCIGSPSILYLRNKLRKVHTPAICHEYEELVIARNACIRHLCSIFSINHQLHVISVSVQCLELLIVKSAFVRHLLYVFGTSKRTCMHSPSVIRNLNYRFWNMHSPAICVPYPEFIGKVHTSAIGDKYMELLVAKSICCRHLCPISLTNCRNCMLPPSLFYIWNYWLRNVHAFAIYLTNLNYSFQNLHSSVIY